ncbi:hypothetical protein FACS189413_13250 [Bacteroidia bacterium]|nr:hypothetical protein FACS189413_13250 [Bacteroidia bacterium]
MYSIENKAITFNVSVPEGTKACYVAGEFNGWDAVNAFQMTQDTPNHFTLNLPNVTTVSTGFKYLSGPDWMYVEKNASGGEISNRTTATANDVVAKWAGLYDPSFITENVHFDFPGGMTSRSITVVTPPGYRVDTDRHYPVVYLHGIRQTYHQGGDDNNGDAFFQEYSWNLRSVLDKMYSEGKETGIVVTIYGYLSEFSPWANEDFMGSGKGDLYLDVIVNQLIPYINGKYRTLTTPEHTTIAGADMGGLISYYAALKYPNRFGKVALFSPAFWFNQPELQNYLGTWQKSGDQKMYFVAGGKESTDLKNLVNEFYESTKAKGFDDDKIRFDIIKTGKHDDVSWGKQFDRAYSYLYSYPFNEETPAGYQFLNHTGTNTVTCTGDKPFESMIYYPNGSAGESEEVMAYMNIIPADFKTTYYWNINSGNTCSGTNLYSSNQTIGFSSSKTTITWQRLIVKAGGEVEIINASKNFFRIVKGDNSAIIMTQTQEDGTAGNDDSFTVAGEVDFSGIDKTFSIYYGSVNSGTKMTALFNPLQVENNCTKAQIIYCFKNNKVTINCLEETSATSLPADILQQSTRFASISDAPSIVSISAVPALCKAGMPVKITSEVKNMQGYQFSYEISHNYGTPATYDTSPNAGLYEYYINAAEQGIYHVKFIAKQGASTISNTIAIKVPYGNDYQNVGKTIVANAYEEVKWDIVNRYKGNFHTHTSQSFDSGDLCHDVVDAYHSKGYQLLALTDHDVNTYPWNLFDLFDENLSNRNPESLDMLAFPSIELSKTNQNNWNESGSSEFNHHNDFFTGRKGQEFATLQESYTYTQTLGGMQLINHPGQYWKITNTYDNAGFQKNSPAWHARNFQTYNSLIGLEVYNQGNKHPNDRILWDAILSMTMPERPVFGYSNDDAHNPGQYFRSYQFMLMDDLSLPALKDAMEKGKSIFSYEPAGSGNALAPRIDRIDMDEINRTITIDSPDEEIYWISGTDKKSGELPHSTIVGYGKTFYYEGFQGNYVRAFLKNAYGETCTQPFGFDVKNTVGIKKPLETASFSLFPNPAKNRLFVQSDSEIETVTVLSIAGVVLKNTTEIHSKTTTVDLPAVPEGFYIVKVKTKKATGSQVITILK